MQRNGGNKNKKIQTKKQNKTEPRFPYLVNNLRPIMQTDMQVAKACKNMQPDKDTAVMLSLLLS